MTGKKSDRQRFRTDSDLCEIVSQVQENDNTVVNQTQVFPGHGRVLSYGAEASTARGTGGRTHYGKINHPHKTVLSTTVRVDKVKDALSNFIGKMVDTLSFLHTHVDATIAILLKSVEFDNEHIFDKPSFLTVVFCLNQRYFNIETCGTFTDALKTQKGRTV